MQASCYFPLSMNFIEKRFHDVAELASGISVTGYFLGTGISSLLVGTLHQVWKVPLPYIFLFAGILAVVYTTLSFITTRGVPDE